MRSAQIFGCTSILAALYLPALAQPAPDHVQSPKPGESLEPLQADYQAYFEKSGIVPIPIPQGQKVGDIIAGSNWELLATSKDCFPGLEPRKAPGSLLSIKGATAAGLSAALGIPSGAHAEADIGDDRSYEVTFSDVTVTSASVVELRTLLKPGIPECEAVRAQLTAADGSPINASQSGHAARPIVIGRLYEARHTIRVLNHRHADADAEVSFFKGISRRFGLGKAEISAKVVGSSETAAEIVSDQSVAVAFEPSFVTRDMLTAVSYLKTDVSYLKVTSYDRNNASSISALKTSLDAAFVK